MSSSRSDDVTSVFVCPCVVILFSSGFLKHLEKDVSRVSYGCLMGVSKVSQGCSKGVPWEFQGSFKDV